MKRVAHTIHAIKPKFHHLFHIPDHIKRTGKLCSCFVLERRHRGVKSAATNIFGNFEQALTSTQLLVIVDRFSNNSFQPDFLDEPTELPESADTALRSQLPGMGPVSSSVAAHLVCGVVRKGDIVMTADRSVGEVQLFLGFTVHGESVVWALLLLRASLGIDCFSIANGRPRVVAGSEILAPLIWGEDLNFIRILPPPISVTW